MDELLAECIFNDHLPIAGQRRIQEIFIYTVVFEKRVGNSLQGVFGRLQSKFSC